MPDKTYRDAGTGAFATKADAEARPDETVAETTWRPAESHEITEAFQRWLAQADRDRWPSDEWVMTSTIDDNEAAAFLAGVRWAEGRRR